MATYDDILGGGRGPMSGLLRPYANGAPAPIVDARTYAMDPNSTGGGGGGATATPEPESTSTTPTRSVRRTKTKTTTTTEAPAPTTTTTTEGDGEKKLSYVEMFQKMNPYTPPTPEEVEKEKRKQKRQAVFAAIGDGISALSNLYFTTTYSPNAWDANNSMSTKMKERWDKLNKERQENQRTYMDGYLRAMAMDDEKARDDRNWRHTLEREEVTDKRYEDEIQHRDKREGIEDKRYDDNIEHRNQREAIEDDHWQRSFEEGQRQFNVTSAQNQQRINIESKRLAHEMQNNGSVTFALGTGKGTITISKGALNSTNVAYVFSKLPETIRNQVHGEGTKVKVPIKNAQGRPTGKYEEKIVYGPPTTEAMLIAIGTNIETCPDAQAALKEVSGQKQPTNNKGKGY
ncbi:MAG: hypothetical protein NC453_26755 [Muribaculum sp.]|nr:hypothetical protein [Muribaculum sp.]